MSWNYKYERMNENKPLWLRSKNEITKKEYKEFLKEVHNDYKQRRVTKEGVKYSI
jgi:HSP90 family molecular chaperone